MAAPVMNPPTPYTTLIPGGFFPGKMIRIQGFVPMHAQRFDVNLQTGAGGEIAGEDVALHASVRLTEGFIARNSFQGGCWQEELGEGGLPIQLGQRFEMLLLCEAFEYKIAVNGQHFCSFPPRVPFNRITHLLVEGDVQIEVIAWEGSSGASAPPMGGPPQYGAPVPPPQYTPQPQQNYVQQAPPPPPGAKMPVPSHGVPLSNLSYGPGTGLYPNLNLHQPTHPSTGHPFPIGGVIPPGATLEMPQPSNPLPIYPDDAHRPFPSHETSKHSSCYPSPPTSPNLFLSEKARKKLSKAEYKAEKRMYKEHKKAERKADKVERKAEKAMRRAERKAAKAERKALRKHGLPTSALVGAGVGAVGAGTLACGLAYRRSSCSSSTSSTSSTSSSD